MVTPMDADPATVGEADSNSTLGLLLAKVTTKPAVAGAPSEKLPWICRNLPTDTPCVMAMPEVDTLATTEPNAAGVEKPVGGGGLTESVLLPADPGWNPLVAPADPAGIVTGETVIVPTPVFELVTLTLTGGTPVMAATA